MSIEAEDLAAMLDRIGDLLAVQHANPHRVRAYHNAAGAVRDDPRSVIELARSDDARALEDVPGIGASLARLLHQVVHTGRCPLLDRLEGQVSPEDLFTTLPGVGEELAHRIHRELGVETLEDLEVAAHDGRLEQVPGMGPRRVAGLRDSLAAILRRSTRRRAQRFEGPAPVGRRAEGEPRREEPGEAGGSAAGSGHHPSVETLLAVDALYRERAAEGALPTIAPRRFNPEHEAWLPILHTERDGWHFTLLFSNTARAHQLDKTRDWVVIFYERDGFEGQCTVVTETRGRLAGRRVVRGREAETARSLPPAASEAVAPA